jgi:hypothetical protein
MAHRRGFEPRRESSGGSPWPSQRGACLLDASPPVEKRRGPGTFRCPALGSALEMGESSQGPGSGPLARSCAKRGERRLEPRSGRRWTAADARFASGDRCHCLWAMEIIARNIIELAWSRQATQSNRTKWSESPRLSMPPTGGPTSAGSARWPRVARRGATADPDAARAAQWRERFLGTFTLPAALATFPAASPAS